MDLDIAKVVSTFNKEQIKDYQQTKKPIFKDIEKYIAKNGGIIGGVMALENMANEANVEFNTENNGYYAFVVKNHNYALAIAEYLSKTKKYIGITVSSNFKGEFELFYSGDLILTLKNTGEKSLKVMPSRTSDNNLSKVTLNYVAPIMLKIEYLLNFIDVQEGVEYWLEYYKRNELLEFVAPFKLTGNEPPKGSGSQNKATADVLSNIREWGVKESRIFIGAYAYLLFMDDSKGYRPNIMFYEMMSVNPEHDISVLKELFGAGNITAKSNYSDLGYHGQKWNISYKDSKVLDLYDSSNYCIPYVEKMYKNEVILLGNYYVVLLYLNLGVLTSYQIETVNKPAAERLRDRLNMIMMELINKRKDYLLETRETGIGGFEQSSTRDLFNVFQTDCIGQQKNYRREWNIKKWNGKIKRFFKEF